MQLADLALDVLERLKHYRYDHIVEKHEGPWEYRWMLEAGELEFLHIEGRDVLLPIYEDRRPHIRVLRCIVGDGGSSLTIFLKDTTGLGDWFTEQDEVFQAGYLAVCDQFPGEAFYVTHVYHEWFMLQDQWA
jgi:hypothetical protein